MTAMMTRETATEAQVTMRIARPASDDKGRSSGRAKFDLGEGTFPLVMTCGEMAVALFYSGAPLSWELTADEVAALIVQGAERIGTARAGEIHRAHCNDGRKFLAGQISAAEYKARERERWPRREGGKAQRDRSQALAGALYHVADGGPHGKLGALSR